MENSRNDMDRKSGGNSGDARHSNVGGQSSSGNFANDRERAREAGRKGGESRGGRRDNDVKMPSE